MTTYKHLSSPFQIGKVTIKNRFVMAPMDTGSYEGEHGEYTADGIEYFVRRAQGGFGLLYSWGHTTDSQVDVFGPTMLQYPAAFLRAGKELNARLEAYGTKMFIQLAFGLGRNVPGYAAPSELPTFGQPEKLTRALTKDDIQKKIDQLVQSAVLAKSAGFAGVEVHALHWGHLLDEFAMSLTNKRTDEYGGSLENRLRIARQLVEGIKQECGADFPVSMRLGLRSYIKGFGKASFTGDEREEAGRTLEESIEIAKMLETYGYDSLSVDTGTLDSFYYACAPSYIPRGYMVEMAAAVKKAVNIPVLAGSRMNTPELAEAGIAEGKFDAIVLGRPSIADPDYPKKVMTGHLEKIRPCIGCNQGCIHRYFTAGYVGCAVNPEMGRSMTYRPNPALTKKKIVVVGGGVAGMEAARIADLRGHDVILLEKTNALGGNLLPAGKHDFKKEVLELNEWYKQELSASRVDIRMNTEATPGLLKELSPDAVILAVGSIPVMPRLKGIDHAKTVSCIEALSERKEVGQKVVIVGGGLVGCEMALEYVREGKQVTIVEALPALLAGDVPFGNRQMLLDAFEHYGVEQLVGHRLSEINDKGAVVQQPDGSLQTLSADTVVMAVGFKPLPSLKGQLADLNVEIYEVGDGNKVGNIMTAIWQAYEVAHSI